VSYQGPDPECDLDNVPNTARKMAVKRVLVTAVDPYGQNSALVVGGNER
jgi:hypothetical protein